MTDTKEINKKETASSESGIPEKAEETVIQRRRALLKALFGAGSLGATGSASAAFCACNAKPACDGKTTYNGGYGCTGKAKADGTQNCNYYCWYSAYTDYYTDYSYVYYSCD